MNTIELMRRLAKKIKLTRSQAKAGVLCVLDPVIEVLAAKQRVSVVGLGTFKCLSILKDGEETELTIHYKGKIPSSPGLKEDEDPFLPKPHIQMLRDIMGAHEKRKTCIDSWQVVPDWTKRAELAASFAKPGEVVADIGCGAMAGERLLPEGCTYLPFDVLKRDERTVVIDLNEDPELPEFEADLVVCLGVIEYIFDVRNVLRGMLKRSSRMVLTYSPRREESLREREMRGWTTHCGPRVFEAMIEEAGWKIMDRPLLDEKGGQIMLVLLRTSVG